MSYIIRESCTLCAACETECPQGCISMQDDSYVIDTNCCVSCGACVIVCPTGAIQQE